MNETETFQHYQVLRRTDGSLWELGRGAMGVTYKAFDTNLRCHVALKVVSGQFLDSEMARARFLREARAAAGLRHRNVASVYHLGDDAESFFYSMEFIDGQTVEALVNARGPLPVADALQVTRQVARALGAAAKQGVVHRDIKPANLMVVHEDEEEDEGFVVKVIDFGLARSALQSTEHTAHITMGGFVGTPQYASPEQLEEKDLDVRSDIYSLGVTLWYMLTGHPPFKGSVFQISSQHLTKPPPWAELSDRAPASVVALLGRMLEKEPALRPQTPAILRAEIEHCTRQLPGETTGVPFALGAAQPESTAVGEQESAAVTLIQGPAPTEGRIFAGRYQLANLVGEGHSGQTFRAYDGRLDGKLVAVKVLRPELNLSPEAFYHLQGDLGRLRDAPHPRLIETFILERIHGYKYTVAEWVNGFSLAKLLSGRGPLPLRDALNLLGQVADAATHGSAHRLHRLALSSGKILLHFPEVGEDNASLEASSFAGVGLEKWPKFSLKIDALSPARDAGRTAAKESEPSTRSFGRDTSSSIRGLVEGSYFYALGVLLHDLLGFPLPPPPGATEISLPLLPPDANVVLRRAFSTNPGFGSENDFFYALIRTCDLRREDVGLPKAPLTEAPIVAVRTDVPTHVPHGGRLTETRPVSARQPPENQAAPATTESPAKPQPSLPAKPGAPKTSAGNQAAVSPDQRSAPPADPPAPMDRSTRPALPAAKMVRAAPVLTDQPVTNQQVVTPQPADVLPIHSPGPALPTLAPPQVAHEPESFPVQSIVDAASISERAKPASVEPPDPPCRIAAAQTTDSAKPKSKRSLTVLLAAAAIGIGGVAATLTLSKRHPVSPPERKPRFSTPVALASPPAKSTPIDAPVTPPPPAPVPIVAATPPALVAPATPVASATAKADEEPAAMEVVSDTVPPTPTPFVAATAPPTASQAGMPPPANVTPPGASAPTPTPRGENTKAAPAASPRTTATPVTPPKRSGGEPTPKTKPKHASPPKPTPPTPRGHDDAPPFMR